MVEGEYFDKIRKEVDSQRKVIQDRTNEIRDLTKYVNQMESKFISQFTEHFKMFRAAFEFQLDTQKEELWEKMIQTKLRFEQVNQQLRDIHEKIDTSESNLIR